MILQDSVTLLSCFFCPLSPTNLFSIFKETAGQLPGSIFGQPNDGIGPLL
jgi:hypothetical protein